MASRQGRSLSSIAPHGSSEYPRFDTEVSTRALTPKAMPRFDAEGYAALRREF
jgi:hypothetical protein